MTRTITLAAGSLIALGGTLLAAPDVSQGGAGSLAPAMPTGNVRPAGPRGAAFVLDPVAGTPALLTDPRVREAQVRAQQLQVERLARLNGGLPANEAQTPATTDAARIPDTFDMLVFGTARPVRIRVVMSYEGKSVTDRWRAAMREAFAYFDRDKDNYLNPFEAQLTFGDNGLAILMQNGFFSPSPGDRPSIDKMDRDGDRRVSFEEFLGYYKLASAAALRPQPPIAENQFNAQSTQALFKLLDTNGDGKLTREELRLAENMIASRDADEDECLSMVELTGTGTVNRGGRPVVVQPPQPPNGVPSPQPNTQVTTVYEAGRVPGTITQRIIKQYDKDGDFELSLAESGFDAATFARLDTDNDGNLSGEELDAWRTGPADLEVSMSLSPRVSDCKVELRTPARTAEDRGFTTRQTEGNRLVIRSGRQTIDLWALVGATTTPGASRFQLKQQFQFLFNQAGGTKGYVEEKDLSGPNGVQFQQIKVMFEPADRDADGKLTKEEFDKYFDVQQQFADIGLSLTPAVQTPTLFQLLDDNRDGRLGVREMRTAWDRLIALEPSGATAVTAGAIQPSVSFRLTRTLERGLAFQQQQFAGNPGFNAPVSTPTRGPIWFRKMDRNGDGDISRMEFLGTKAEFDAIDTDHDGLLSLTEAEEYQKKMDAEKK